MGAHVDTHTDTHTHTSLFTEADTYFLLFSLIVHFLEYTFLQSGKIWRTEIREMAQIPKEDFSQSVWCRS